MLINHHVSWNIMSTPRRDQIKEGITVSIETKENQGTGKLTQGVVSEILTSSQVHPHGIKVRLKDGQVGRVKQIAGENKAEPNTQESVDLEKKAIPETEDQHNEFKEFYQYDKNMEHHAKTAIDGMKHKAQERFAIAVCSFANSSDGGFVYVGINSEGNVTGLEHDLKLGGFSDYGDAFANHMVDRLTDLTEDKVFVNSKVQIKFRQINDKTICLVQVLPADSPVYLRLKEKSFFVRGAAPKAVKLDVDEQFKYIKQRFPRYG